MCSMSVGCQGVPLVKKRASSSWCCQASSLTVGRSQYLIRNGGRFYERYTDGEEHAAGQVLRWEPPRGIAYTWQHDNWAGPTEVEVRFIAEAPGVTRVELEHRAWDRLGAIAAEMREMYQNGWPTVLGCFESLAGAA